MSLSAQNARCQCYILLNGKNIFNYKNNPRRYELSNFNNVYHNIIMFLQWLLALTDTDNDHFGNTDD